MGLITEEVEIHIYRNCKDKEYYWNLGYDFKIGDTIIVAVKDLKPSSGIKVQCTCDYCGKELTKSYCDYNKAMSCVVKKIACHNCHSRKNKEIFMTKYGVDNPNKLSTVRERIKKTNQNRYGVECPFQINEVQEKIKEKMMDKYGVEYPGQSKEIKEKIIQTNYQKYGTHNPLCRNSSIYNEIQDKKRSTNLSKYGVENPMQNEDIKRKTQQTCLERYGAESPLQSKEIQHKIKNTLIEKYGVDNPMKCEEIKEKAKNTMLELYGVEYNLQNKEIFQNMIDNNIKKYGVKYVSQIPEVRYKINKTLYENYSMCTSKQQKYIADLYKMELNYPILYWSVDMYDKDNDICCEYDGGGHFLEVELGKTTQEEFDNKELVREKLIKQDGHKIMRIISKTDKLPSDQILLQMLSDTKQYFQDYPEHSWINFDIDNGIIRNAENKEGESYDYGQLRKIKKTDLESA